MILPIYTYGQPVLRKVAEDIPLDYPGLQELIQDMFETCTASDGIGLAAPQIGKAIRLVIIDLDVISEHYPEYKGYRHAFINGHIIEVDEEDTDTMEEGCLSIPGIHEKVKRPKKIHIKYVDENLKEHDEWVDGYLARVIQHEFDHIDGKLFTDHISPFRKQMIGKKLKAIASGNFQCRYKVKPALKK